ncbi:hypothetical protein K2Z84_15925 [Candidatus Binatia bacterium]|jgi:hypothetical protein|nr:hypothetical protein [Candidatus Binatia bacterium]
MRRQTIRAIMVLALALFAGSTAAPSPAAAEQVCGCKKLSNGKVNNIRAGAFPTCNLISQAMVCWDSPSGGTTITAGPGLQSLPDPITSSGTMSVDAPTCAGTDKLTWSGSAFQCSTDQTSASLNQNNCYYETGCANPGCNGCTRSCTCSVGYYPAGSRMYRDPDGSYGGFDLYCCKP